jgi:hypothetical protein
LLLVACSFYLPMKNYVLAPFFAHDTQVSFVSSIGWQPFYFVFFFSCKKVIA